VGQGSGSLALLDKMAFSLSILEVFLLQDLQCYRAVYFRVERSAHKGHAAFANLFVDFVTSYFLSYYFHRALSLRPL
jgi:hypothetical protein